MLILICELNLNLRQNGETIIIISLSSEQSVECMYFVFILCLRAPQAVDTFNSVQL